MKFRSPIVWLVLMGILLLGQREVRAEDSRRADLVQQALAQMEAEPSITDVHQAALRYFRVNPEAVERIRRVAVRRAAAPEMTITGRYEYVNSQRDVIHSPEPAAIDDSFGSNVAGGSLSLRWDFGGLVFNPAELQTYALIGIQMNVLKEVTRLYYVRRQLLLSLMADPPDDPRTRVAMRLRVEEFTSLIDSFTGGWFSRNLPNDSN